MIEITGENKPPVKQTPEPQGKLIAQLAQQVINEGGFEAGITNDMAQGHQDLLKEAVEKGREAFQSDFFIDIEVKKERATINLIHLHPFCFKKCPTPLPGQTMYHYIHAENRVELLWQLLPARMCKWLEDNAFHLDDGQKMLYQEYLKLKDGTLLKLAKFLNGE